MHQKWAYYNEFDEHAADWLENLIRMGLIAPGVVDRRSIEDVCPDDIRGFRQVHFFAGIGVWSYSLRRVGVPDDFALWTGSCPCQPFSAAGKSGGVDDERHLWPALYHLIKECRPRRFFGEQVASKDGLGWLDLVLTDMEEARYTIGALDSCSAGSGAPHIRQRLRIAAYDFGSASGGLQHTSGDGWLERWAEPGGRGAFRRRGAEWLADADGRDACSEWQQRSRQQRQQPEDGGTVRLADDEGSSSRAGFCNFESAGCRSTVASDGSAIDWLDDDDDAGLEGFWSGHCSALGQREGSLRPASASGELGGMADDHHQQQRRGRDTGSAVCEGLRVESGGCDEFDWLASGDHDVGRSDVEIGRPEGRTSDGRRGATVRLADGNVIHDDGAGSHASHELRQFSQARGISSVSNPDGFAGRIERPGPTNGHWRDADWLFCRDGKWRPVEPGTFPLVDGAAFRLGSGSAFEGKSRQGMLKGYGNAIDAEATADFLEACFEWEADRARADALVRDFADLLG